MTNAEAVDLVVDFVTDYFPKAGNKTIKREFAISLLREFAEQGVLELEDEFEDAEESDE